MSVCIVIRQDVWKTFKIGETLTLIRKIEKLIIYFKTVNFSDTTVSEEKSLRLEHSVYLVDDAVPGQNVSTQNDGIACSRPASLFK